MTMDRKYLLWGIAYAIIGMLLGIVMASSGNHGQYVTHAHILLVGFVTSLLYATIHRLWLITPSQILARVQFSLHQLGAVVMSTGLFLMYGNGVDSALLHPILGLSSIAVLTAMVLMGYLVIRAR